MNHHLPYFRLPQKKVGSQPTISCMTINQAEAPLGLMNLLDIVRHDVCQENGQQTHQLTFRSGHILSIKANSRQVTVRGTKIISSDSVCGKLTLLMDPGKNFGAGL